MNGTVTRQLSSREIARFKVLSFKLCSAPSQFARIMELVMPGLTYDICLVYLDDILVFLRPLKSTATD